MLALSEQEDHPGKMTQALVCLCGCVCVHTTLELHTHLTECSTRIFRTFAVNINACLYLHGSLWAVCLLVRVCLANPLSQSLEWKAEAHCWWRGERGLQAPSWGTVLQRYTAAPSLHSGHVFLSFMFLSIFSHSHLSELCLPFLLSSWYCHLSVLSCQAFCFVFCFLFTCNFPPPLLPPPTPPPATSTWGNLISPSSWPVHNDPSLHGW